MPSLFFKSHCAFILQKKINKDLLSYSTNKQKYGNKKIPVQIKAYNKRVY